jgi:hypothetical protein
MKTKQLQLVTFEQAKRLKMAGFNWPTIAVYEENEEGGIRHELHFYQPINHNNEFFGESLSVPTVALALKWFRDEKDIVCHVITQMKHFRLEYRFLYRLNYAQVTSNALPDCEAAESALLDELLNILEKEKKQ